MTSPLIEATGVINMEGTHSSKLYLAKIVFNIVTGVTCKRHQFEEQLRLVEAVSLEEAFLKARAIGIGQEEIICRDGVPATKWEFVDVADLLPLPAWQNGAEIYSQIHETNESHEYIRHVHQRGKAIRLNLMQNA
jgi:hypothetical protein